MRQVLLGMTAWKDLVDVQIKNSLAVMAFWKSVMEKSQKR